MSLSVAEASAGILSEIRRLDPERTALLDATGRVLAESVISRVSLPPWDNSGMDGYAVLAADVEGATMDRPVRLPVVETVVAGRFPSRGIARGEAFRIMTGAPVPAGADTVIRVEDTDGGTAAVAIRDTRDARQNVRPQGQDIRAGDTALEAGSPIGPAQIGILAAVGAASVSVYRRPRVAIIGSGDELVDIDRFGEVLSGQKIVSSNTYTLHALVRASGGEPVPLGVAQDTQASLVALLERARGCDLILTTAGISVGETDHARGALAALGAELRFWRVRMRPGAPIGFGLLGGVPWIGLPGNPVSTQVTYELFVRPAIRKMQGHEMLFRRPIPVGLAERVQIQAGLTHFLRGIVTTEAAGATARLTGPQGSGLMTSMARANALIVAPGDRATYAAGDTLNALLLTDEAQLSDTFAF